MPEKEPFAANTSFGMGAVTGWYRAEVAPVGTAPPEMREAWRGVWLPIRHELPPEQPQPAETFDILTFEPVPISDAVHILNLDSYEALQAQSNPDAVAWWRQHWFSYHWGKLATSLTFDKSRGKVVPPGMKERFFPN